MLLSETVAAHPELGNWVVEMNELDRLLGRLGDDDWHRVTSFKGWTILDHVHHLNISDLLAHQSAADAEGFRAARASEKAAAVFAADAMPKAVPPAEMLARWRRDVAALGAALAKLDPSARLPWFGPDMSLRAFVAARQMETWSHGQTIHDAAGATRIATDRLRPICELGWRTFGWSFHIRGHEPPAEPLSLKLTAPSGALWSWGVDGAANAVRGSAEDFALVVCQCRNFADTGLRSEGPIAERWMAIAQCFAGPPVDPPAPGSRAPIDARG